MNNSTISLDQKYKKLIIFISILIPVVVAALFGINLKRMGYDVQPLSFLPPIYASINGLTALLLVVAVLAIKKGNKKLHQILVNIAIACSLAFLVMYVAYHMTSDPTPFGGEGLLSFVYYFILISHILLSVIIIPLVLFTYVKAWAGKFDEHKKWAKITFPIWLYVAVTGVLVYLMISPYYAN